MLSFRKPRHLYLMTLGAAALGEAACGAKAKFRAAKVCEGCRVEYARHKQDQSDALNVGVNESTLAHMELLTAWLMDRPVASLTADPRAVMTQYLSESALWSRVDDSDHDIDHDCHPWLQHECSDGCVKPLSEEPDSCVGCGCGEGPCTP